MNKHTFLSAWAIGIVSVCGVCIPAHSQEKVLEQVQELLQEQETTKEAVLTPEEQAEQDTFVKEANALLGTLNPQYGEIKIASAGVTLNLPENFYYLDTANSRTVLEKAWGNPPDESILGMIFEADTHAFNNDYAVVITFDASGYVSDEDAQDLDFSKMLKTMQKDTNASNPARIAEGYDKLELVGWADTPNYDAADNRLSWAKSIRFGDSETNTLNYNLRFLGRKGVLEFNYVAEESALEMIKSTMPNLIQMASFDEGHRYSDFNATTDKIASYGVAGLIAGGLVAKKVGLLAVLLLFLKKGWILILAGLALGKRFLGGMFKRKENNEPADNTHVG